VNINFKKLGELFSPGSIVAAVVLVFVCLVLIFYSSEIGMASDIGIREPDFTNVDFSSVPQSVIDNAGEIADELVGEEGERHQEVVTQLVGSYIAARDVDIVIYFNSGGMGWNYVADTPGWSTILDGITGKLEELGYRPLVINYCRTSRGLWGSVKEIIEASTRYTKKVNGMEKHVGFLVDNLPELKMIVTGESTGCVLTEVTMDFFRDNPNVYSIQTGMPWWFKTEFQERTLRINTNGTCEDAFSHGNVAGMMWSTFKHWVGLSSPEEDPGNILKFLRAPGHAYSWDYPAISSAVCEFLEDNFPKKN
jgi:hypothetical protein